MHFWDRRRFDYAWLAGAGPALERDFRPDDLAPELAPLVESGPVSLVFVQADCRSNQGAAEAAWVHGLAAAGAPVLAVVAHASLERGDDCAAELDELVREAPLVSGVRRLLQDEPPGFVTDASLAAGVRLLASRGLTMDLCVRQHQLDQVAELVEGCPDVLFVLDHLGKPRIADEELGAWATDISRIAALPNVRCKLSGLLSEAPPERRTSTALRPWLDHALGAFGPERCMFGSDWPVLTGAGGYDQWHEIVLGAISGLTEAERNRVLSGTAAATYDPVNRAARAKDPVPWL